MADSAGSAGCCSAAGSTCSTTCTGRPAPEPQPAPVRAAAAGLPPRAEGEPPRARGLERLNHERLRLRGALLGRRHAGRHRCWDRSRRLLDLSGRLRSCRWDWLWSWDWLRSNDCLGSGSRIDHWGRLCLNRLRHRSGSRIHLVDLLGELTMRGDDQTRLGAERSPDVLDDELVGGVRNRKDGNSVVEGERESVLHPRDVVGQHLHRRGIHGKGRDLYVRETLLAREQPAEIAVLDQAALGETLRAACRSACPPGGRLRAAPRRAGRHERSAPSGTSRIPPPTGAETAPARQAPQGRQAPQVAVSRQGQEQRGPEPPAAGRRRTFLRRVHSRTRLPLSRDYHRSVAHSTTSGRRGRFLETPQEFPGPQYSHHPEGGDRCPPQKG